MGLRFYVMTIGLFGLLFVIGAGGSMAAAQQGNETQGSTASSPMSMAVPANGPTDSRESLVNKLDLKMYEAVKGDLSLCADGEGCLTYAKDMRFWICADTVCNGTGNSKKPFDCFGVNLDKYSKEDQDQINSSICSLIKSPSTVTRQAMLSHMPDLRDDYMVGGGADLLALKGSAESCENYIKNYVGAYGSQWTYQWYVALSGCRILAHERTRKEEEKDFLIWFGVAQGSGSCSDIVNSEMRKACSAHGAKLFNYGQ